jgi:hypothetical protein
MKRCLSGVISYQVAMNLMQETTFKCHTNRQFFIHDAEQIPAIADEGKDTAGIRNFGRKVAI